ncbi:hypothetical protein FHS72_002111 [Loktanella ponticola]|uniref:Uncharacterized protein n=1 Tax=Yoonia ponticola TaxID=1524255 RepID=A0A7W9EZS5_9RHOB|nr:hypothetical protein [Yoonia ponticola]MBB5722485.1 hypothetical protein [Yoonia ponticola]
MRKAAAYRDVSWGDAVQAAAVCWIGLPSIAFAIAFAIFSLPYSMTAADPVRFVGAYTGVIAASVVVSWLPLAIMVPVVQFVFNRQMGFVFIGFTIGTGVGGALGFGLFGQQYLMAGLLVGAIYGATNFAVLRRLNRLPPHK